MASILGGYTTVQQVDSDDSFERLFIAEYARVVAIANRVVADPDEAEDVAQDVFMSFHRTHSPSAIFAPAWLHRAAVHTALNLVRGKRRRAQREVAKWCEQGRLRPAGEDMLDPQRAIEVGERRREVREALARLPARSASVLVLRYSGLSYAEVADALGVGTNQIGTLLRRAEDALRKEVEGAAPF